MLDTPVAVVLQEFLGSFHYFGRHLGEFTLNSVTTILFEDDLLSTASDNMYGL